MINKLLSLLGAITSAGSTLMCVYGVLAGLSSIAAVLIGLVLTVFFAVRLSQ